MHIDVAQLVSASHLLIANIPLNDFQPSDAITLARESTNSVCNMCRTLANVIWFADPAVLSRQQKRSINRAPHMCIHTKYITD